MKNLLLPLLMAVVPIAAQAQVTDSTSDASITDTVVVPVDTTRASGVLKYADERRAHIRSERVRTTTAPTRSEREQPAGYGSGSTKTGKAVKFSKGREFSLERTMDPEGRKHWKRMNKKSRRQLADVPPGTVPPR